MKTAGNVVGLPAFWRAHLVQVVGGAGPARGCSGPLVVCPLLLSALSVCPCWVVLEICLYSHFKGVFSGFPLLDVYLYCLRALRGLWGFCVRERLGGLKACCVFASLFVLLPFFFCSCVCLLLCWLSFFALVVFLCSLALSLWLFGCGCCFLFPFGLYAKRKGAPCRCVLSSIVIFIVTFYISFIRLR